MIKQVLVFLLVWVSVAISIKAWRQLSGKEKWSVTKIALYGLLTSTIAFVILSLVVILF